MDCPIQRDALLVMLGIPLEPQPRDGPVPASFAQSRMWLVKRLGLAIQTGAATPFEWQLSGKLDPYTLRRAFSELAQRQDSLRTRFQVVDGIPHQFVDCPAVQLDLIDLQGLDGRQQAARVDAVRRQQAHTVFDLARGPLLRAQLMMLSGHASILLLKMHHIIYDGWSFGVLVRELSQLYNAFAHGESHSPLPALPIQYVDYAIWQRKWLRGEMFAKQLLYWKRQLAGLPVLQLPTDRPRPPRRSFVGARVPLTVPGELTRALRGLARQERVTLYMLLLAALQLALSRWSGQTDIAVASPTAGRIHRKTEAIIGFFLNVLVMRTDLTGDPSFRALLARVRRVTLEADTHQHVPFERLILKLATERDPSRHPLCQVQFNCQNLSVQALDFPGVTARAIPAEHLTARYDLTLDLTEGPEEFSGHLDYATDLFEAATVERFARQFVGLLEAVVADPECRMVGRPLSMEPTGT